MNHDFVYIFLVLVIGFGSYMGKGQNSVFLGLGKEVLNSMFPFCEGRRGHVYGDLRPQGCRIAMDIDAEVFYPGNRFQRE